MQAYVKLKPTSPVALLLDLTADFNTDIGDSNRAFISNVEGVPDLDARDYDLIVSARLAIRKSLSEGNYVMAKLAYQVLDCVLRDVIEPAACVMHEHDADHVFWVSNNGREIPRDTFANIANVMRDVREKAKFGIPDQMSDSVCEAVRAYAADYSGPK